MARKADYGLPVPIASACIAIIADYSRRSKAIERGNLPSRVAEEYERLNAAVDRSFYDFSPLMNRAIRKDIELGNRGWEKSEVNPFCAKRIYYAWKKKAVRRMATNLKLI